MRTYGFGGHASPLVSVEVRRDGWLGLLVCKGYGNVRVVVLPYLEVLFLLASELLSWDCIDVGFDLINTSQISCFEVVE